MMISPDSIIMTKVVDIVNQPSSSISDFAHILIPKIPVIICMVVIKKCIENIGDVFDKIWTNIKNIFYKLTYTDIPIYDNDPLFYYRKKYYCKYNLRLTNQFFPIYFAKPTEFEPAVLSLMNWFPTHRKLIQNIDEEASRDKSEQDDAKNRKKTIYKKLNGNKFTYEDSNASHLFPSTNYTNLVKIIKTHNDISRLVQSYSVLGILIDGEPGLGKTKFADFASESKIIPNIYKVDMTTLLEHPFNDILQKVYHQIDIINNTLFMIDEIDKYIDYRIKFQYNQLKNNKEPITQSYHEYYLLTKNTYLYDILSILERDGLLHSVVVIFCSNNFKSVFQGVDITHHKSLYDRFVKIKFDLCDHDEIIRYISFYNDKFINTEYFHDIKTISNLLKPDIAITHRTLHHISIESKYNPIDMVNRINNFIENNIELSKCLNLDDDIITKIDEFLSEDDLSERKNISSDNSFEKKNIAENNSFKNDDIPVIKVKEPKEYKELWKEKYKCEKPTKLVQNEIVDKIRNYLNECENARGQDNKTKVAINLINYLAEDGYKLLYHFPQFKKTVKAKIFELSQHNNFVNNLSPSADEFAYALTGKHF